MAAVNFTPGGRPARRQSQSPVSPKIVPAFQLFVLKPVEHMEHGEEPGRD